MDGEYRLTFDWQAIVRYVVDRQADSLYRAHELVDGPLGNLTNSRR
jgi:hypothetical protein